MPAPGSQQPNVRPPAVLPQPTMLPPALFPPMMPSPRPLHPTTFAQGMATTQPGDPVLMMQAWQALQQAMAASAAQPPAQKKEAEKQVAVKEEPEHSHEAEASNVVAPAEPAIVRGIEKPEPNQTPPQSRQRLLSSRSRKWCCTSVVSGLLTREMAPWRFMPDGPSTRKARRRTTLETPRMWARTSRQGRRPGFSSLQSRSRRRCQRAGRPWSHPTLRALDYDEVLFLMAWFLISILGVGVSFF